MLKVTIGPRVELHAGEDRITLNYRGSPLITYYPSGFLVADTYGYMSRSVLAALNNYLPDGFSVVHIPDSLWQIRSRTDTAIFYDGIRLHEAGEIHTDDSHKGDMLVRHAIARQYVAGYQEVMTNGGLYREVELRSVPDEYDYISRDTIAWLHLQKHYPPQLLTRAVQHSSVAAPYYSEAVRMATEQWVANDEILRAFRFALRRYIRRCMGVPL